MATATIRPACHVEIGRWVLLLHLVLSPLLFSTWTSDCFEGPKAALLTAASLTLAGLAASAWVARGAPLQLRPPTDLATLGLILFVGSATLSTIFSISPLISWHGAPDSCAGLQTLLGYLVLYLFTRMLCRTAEDGRRLLAAAVVGSAVSAGYALIQAAHFDPAAWGNVSAFGDRIRPVGTFGHPNSLSAYLVMAAPLVALFLLQAVVRRRWDAALALAVIGAAAAAAVVAALSRAAWLAAGAAALALAAGWFLAGRRRTALVLGGLTLLGVVAVCCWWTATRTPGQDLAGSVAARLSRLGDGAGRWQIWRASWELFRDRPTLGCGPDALHLAFGARRPADYANVEWDTTPTRAHNVALHILATQGVIGAAAAAVFAVGLVLAVLRAWRRASPADRPLVAAVAASVAAFLVQDLFGFTVVGCGSLFVTCAALLSRWGEVERDATPAIDKPGVFLCRLLLGGGLAVVLFLVNVGWSGIEPTAILALAAVLSAWAVWRVESMSEHLLYVWPGPSGAQPRLSTASSLPGPYLVQSRGCATLGPGHPQQTKPDPPTTLTISWKALAVHVTISLSTIAALYILVMRPIQASIACGSGDRIVGAAPAEALAHYEQAAALAPEDDHDWTQLSAAAQLASRQAAPEKQRRLLEQARAALDRAAALVPAAPYHRANLGRLLGEMAVNGLARGDDALAEWDAALAADPLNAVFLAEAARTALAVGRYDRARRWTARGLELYPQYALLINDKGACDFAEGRLDDAAAALERSLPAEWHADEDGYNHAVATFAAVELARGRFDHANLLAGVACDRDSSWAAPYLLKARALQALGRNDEARQQYQRVLTLDPGNAEARAALFPPVPMP